MDRVEIVIVGAGAVGCAIAVELLKRGHKDIFIFEKSLYLADGQSGRNSGVVHSGIYYQEGSLKARLCVEGNRLMYGFCKENDVPCVKTGKLIVATSKKEDEQIEQLFVKANKIGAPGLRMIGEKEVRAFEPNVYASSAIYAPETGSVDAAAYVKALARIAESLGAQLLLQTEVTSIESKGDGFVVEVTRSDGKREQVETGMLINAAGLYSDKIAKMINPGWQKGLAPMRGEYFKFNRARRNNIQMKGLNIYPAPETVRVGDNDVLVVGIHLTPTFDILSNGSTGIGNIVTVGPEFVPATDREDYESNRKSKDIFYEKAKRFFPNLKPDDLEMDFAGIMANLGSGKDWIVERDKAHPNCIQLVGIDSPALTSSMAIARHVADMI